jgi:hypothetical protein
MTAIPTQKPQPLEPKPPFELCFTVMADSCVRLRGGRDGLYQLTRQLTYRCGMCWSPVTECDLNRHYDEHAQQIRTMTADEVIA